MSFFGGPEVVGSNFPVGAPDVLFSTLSLYGDKVTYHVMRCIALGVIGEQLVKGMIPTGIAHISPGIARGQTTQENPGYLDLCNWLEKYSKLDVGFAVAGGVVGSQPLQRTDVDMPTGVNDYTSVYVEMQRRVQSAVELVFGSQAMINFMSPTDWDANPDFNGLSVKVTAAGKFEVIYERKVGAY